MAMTLRQLLRAYRGKDLHLAAGESGLDRPVSWVHVSEMPDPGRFLRGGELVVMTCVGIDEKAPDAWLLERLRSLVSARAAGVVLNIGDFLPDIPPACAAFCEAEGLPLFSLPWQRDLQAVTRPLCEAIVRENEGERQLSRAFRSAVLYHERQELYVPTLAEFHFETEDRYAVCLMQVRGSAQEPYEEAEALRAKLAFLLQHMPQKAAVFSENRWIAVVVCAAHTADVRAFFTALLADTRAQLPCGETLLAGVGKLTRSVRCLYKSYRQAEAIVRLQEARAISPNCAFYADTGIYRLLLGVEDDDIRQDYVDQTIGPLLAHDREKGSDLTNVLRTYLKNNGSLARTAAELYIHKNTVTYKLNQAAAILSADLTSLAEKMQLYLAILIHDMMNHPLP